MARLLSFDMPQKGAEMPLFEAKMAADGRRFLLNMLNISIRKNSHFPIRPTLCSRLRDSRGFYRSERHAS